MATNYYHITCTVTVKAGDIIRYANEDEFTGSGLVLNTEGMAQTEPSGDNGEYLGNGTWIWYRIQGFWPLPWHPIGPGDYNIKATYNYDTSRYTNYYFTLV